MESARGENYLVTSESRKDGPRPGGSQFEIAIGTNQLGVDDTLSTGSLLTRRLRHRT
jgi:hypothetical protein